MKTAKLVPHTSICLDIPETLVKTTTRTLQAATLLTVGGRGPGGAELTTTDFANVFVAVCGVGQVMRAGHEIPKWREAAPDLFEYIERRIEDGTGLAGQLVFFVDRYSARKVGANRTQSYGEKVDARSYLTRTVTASAFQDWVEGLRG